MPSTNKSRVALNNRVPSSEDVADSTKEVAIMEDEEEAYFKQRSSAFSEGLTRQSVLHTGCSDDSDLPRLSPIRTRSETDLNTWERSKQKLHISHPQITEGESTETLFNLQTEFGGYHPRNSAALFNRTELSDLCLSPEGATTTTTTSGNCSALSEDVWQMVSSSEFPAMNSDITTTTTTTTTFDDQNTPTAASSSARFTNRSLSSLFDSLTTSIHKGLFNLAVKVERATSDAARVSVSGMRCVSDIKPDNSFYEVDKSTELAGNAIMESIKKVELGDSPICKQDSASYEASFTRSGGQNLYEELESLCNDYAKKLNKQRKNLKDSKKSELDSFMMRLYPIFDVVGSPTESEDEDRETGAHDAHLSHFHKCLDEIVGNSVSIASQKERSAILEIANLVANPINVLGSASSIPLTPQTSRIAELYVELEAAVQYGKHSLELIHEEGVQRMAELSTCCVKYLLEIGSELTMSSPPIMTTTIEEASREKDLKSPSSSSTSTSPHSIWPNNGEEIALLLRAFAIRLIHNLEAVTAAFLAALLGVGNSYDENLRDYSVGQKANALASDLELDSCSAVRKVQESLRNLMYVVVYTTF